MASLTASVLGCGKLNFANHLGHNVTYRNFCCTTFSFLPSPKVSVSTFTKVGFALFLQMCCKFRLFIFSTAIKADLTKEILAHGCRCWLAGQFVASGLRNR